MTAFTLEIENCIDHVFDDPRPRDLPFLGNVPYEDDADAAALGKCRKFVGGGTDLADRTRRAVNGVQPHGLNRINDCQIWRFLLQRRHDVAKVGFGCQLDGGIAQAETPGAHSDLRGSFLAGNIDGVQTLLGKSRSRLQQKCRLANTWIAPHQNGCGRHHSSSKHTIEFGDSALSAPWRTLRTCEIR